MTQHNNESLMASRVGSAPPRRRGGYPTYEDAIVRIEYHSFFGGGGGFVASTLGRSSMRAMNCAMCYWPSTIALLSGKRCR